MTSQGGSAHVHYVHRTGVTVKTHSEPPSTTNGQGLGIGRQILWHDAIAAMLGLLDHFNETEFKFHC